MIDLTKILNDLRVKDNGSSDDVEMTLIYSDTPFLDKIYYEIPNA